ncbi:MAG: hypothetical protein VW806_12415 [Halieaceae bacterium]
MIRILATALLALSLTASAAFATSMDDLVKREGLYYKKFTDTPFTGLVDEGKTQGEFQKGVRNGTQWFYTEDGTLHEKYEMRNGSHHGLYVRYHSNGALETKGQYYRGLKQGIWEQYYQSGQMKLTGMFQKSLKTGTFKAYHSNGQLQM